jgi:hypothetical protein
MRTQTLKCDKCGTTETVKSGTADTNTKLKLMTVGTAVCDPMQVYHYSSSVPQTWMQHRQEWCEECRNKLGLVWRSEEQQKEKPYPTLNGFTVSRNAWES